MTMILEVPDKSHYLFGFSGAAGWIACPGRIALSEGAPNTSSSDADEGTAAHAYIEDRFVATEKPYASKVKVGATMFDVTDEMVEAYNVWFAAVERARGAHGIARPELMVNAPWLGDDIGGTCDMAVLDGDLLTVFDFKYGRGHVVNPEWNAQLLGYAGCLLHAPNAQCVKKVVLTIVQPRAAGEPIRSWTTTPEEVKAWWTNTLEPAYRLAKKVRAEYRKGTPPICHVGEHCRWCKGMAKCAAMAQHATAVTSATLNSPTFPDPAKLTGVELAKLLGYTERLQEWCEAVHVRARQAVEEGLVVPGYKLVATQGHRKWKEGAEGKVLDLLGESAYQPAKLVSPAQAEKIAKSEKARIAELCERPEAGVALVKDTDKRPGIVCSATKELLSHADFLQ